VTSPAIVLSRVNFNEVDRIVTFLGPKGQFAAMVKGVRKVKSKLAGGIELFSISQITYLDTKSDLKVVVQSSLIEHFGDIAGNLERMLFAYDCMKFLKKITPEETDDENYYLNLRFLLEALNDSKIDLNLIKLWWLVRVLDLTGHGLELQKDAKLKQLFEGQDYGFVVGSARLTAKDGGVVSSDVIKILRLMQEGRVPKDLAKLKDINVLSKKVYVELELASRELLS
jgi:DNA repair protein RecO (recombination protein O)